MTSEMLADKHTSVLQSISQKVAIDNRSTLRDCVETTLNNYFAQLDGAPVTDLYQLVQSEVEAPLLEQVLKYTRNNQTKASELLGLNRGTLRKKLKQYDLL